ncbi:MAG: hypothetical protein METHAR1v1_310015 [Methanothrix sp.]|nr:MAG: hypothetical protein METHAR1v1_310015 [Methanothrix sp.]
MPSTQPRVPYLERNPDTAPFFCHILLNRSSIQLHAATPPKGQKYSPRRTFRYPDFRLAPAVAIILEWVAWCGLKGQKITIGRLPAFSAILLLNTPVPAKNIYR